MHYSKHLSSLGISAAIACSLLSGCGKRVVSCRLSSGGVLEVPPFYHAEAKRVDDRLVESEFSFKNGGKIRVVADTVYVLRPGAKLWDAYTELKGCKKIEITDGMTLVGDGRDLSPQSQVDDEKTKQ
jgi:hypothetical protein